MNARTQNGFSLVELMIAMTLGLVLTGGLISIFINNRHSFDRDDVILSMQDDARHAIRELVNDLTMAGLWADLILPASIVPDTSLAVGIDCGPVAAADWIYRAVIPGTSQSESLTMVDNATVASANASFSCLGAEIVPGPIFEMSSPQGMKRYIATSLIGWLMWCNCQPKSLESHL